MPKGVLVRVQLKAPKNYPSLAQTDQSTWLRTKRLGIRVPQDGPNMESNAGALVCRPALKTGF